MASLKVLAAILAALVVILAATFGTYYVGLNGTISSLQSQVSSLQTSSNRTVTVTAQLNYTTTSTVTAQLNYTTTSTLVTSWYGLAYLTANQNCGFSGNPPTRFYPIPCFGSNSPIVFNCAAQAATAQGCVQRVSTTATPSQSFIVAVWYPYINHTAWPEWQNCKWVVTSIPVPPGPWPQPQKQGGYCIPMNSTSFLIATMASAPA